MPHPSRAGLLIDTGRSLDVRSATHHYAVFAYRDEEVQLYRRGEYRVPKRVFVLCRLALTPLPVALELVLDDEWTCEHLVVARPPDRPPITQTILKQIPVKVIAAVMSPRAADRLVQRAGGGLERKIAVLTGGTAAYLEATGRAGNPRRGKRLDRAHLQTVADMYRLEVARGRRDPVWVIADHFNVARSTAGRWVALCRKRGVLGPAKRGSKGERRPP